PRSEDPARIASDIVRGFSGEHCYRVVHDRATAIAEAIAMAGPEDLVLVAGKGHEAWQEVAGQKLPFSDSEQVRHQLNLNGGVAGCAPPRVRKPVTGSGPVSLVIRLSVPQRRLKPCLQALVASLTGSCL